MILSLFFLVCLSGSILTKVDLDVLTEQTNEVDHVVDSVTDEVLGNRKDLLGKKTEKDEKKDLEVGDIEEFNESVGTLDEQIDGVWNDLCTKYFKHSDEKHLAIMKSEGCSELFKGINEGIESKQHTMRLSSSAIFGMS